MRRTVGVLIAIAALLASPVSAPAQKSGVKLQQELHGEAGQQGADDAKAHPEGDYGGVVPGKAEGPPPKGRRPVVTWIGFLARGASGSRFFVQLSRETRVQQDLVGNTLRVTIAGARFDSRNTRRRLDTRFFDTSVREIVPRRVGRRRARKGKPGHPAGVQLAITFKNPSDAGTASLRTATEQDGYTYVYLDFGPGTPAAEGP